MHPADLRWRETVVAEPERRGTHQDQRTDSGQRRAAGGGAALVGII